MLARQGIFAKIFTVQSKDNYQVDVSAFCLWNLKGITKWAEYRITVRNICRGGNTH